MSTLKTNTLDTPNGSGNITVNRPTILTAGDIVTADIAADAIDGTKLADNACDSEHYTDGSIDLVHLQTGTDGQIITWDASGDPVAVGPGTDGQVLTSTGAGSPPAFEAAAGGGGPTLATEQDLTGVSARTFGSIPAGTKLIHLLFDEASLAASGYSADNISVTIGDSGGLETASYINISLRHTGGVSPAAETSTSAFDIGLSSSGQVVSGIFTLTLINAAAFSWVASHTLKASTSQISTGGGTKSLSAELTQVSVTRTGTPDFSGGSVSILYF